MLPTLGISVSDSTTVRDAAAVVVGATAVMGIANPMQLTAVAPEWHPHNQPRREPLATVDALTMTFVVVGCVTAPRVRQLFWYVRAA